MVIALPDLDGVALRRRSGDPVAPPIPLLPARVDYDSVVARAGDELGAHILLGLEERRGQPVAVDFGRHPHLLVLGDNECGKTAALRTLCREIVRTHTAARAQLLIVDFRHTLLDVIESEHMGGYVSSPAALGAKLSSLVDLLQARMPAPDVSQAQLRARSWWSGPDIYVVVDDYDLVAVSSGNPLMVLLEYLPHARDLGLHLVVARRSGGAARALFEPVLASLRDLGCRALLMSGRPDEGALFGSSRPMPLPPGRASWSPVPVTSNWFKSPGAHPREPTSRGDRGGSGCHPPIVLWRRRSRGHRSVCRRAGGDRRPGSAAGRTASRRGFAVVRRPAIGGRRPP